MGHTAVHGALRSGMGRQGQRSRQHIQKRSMDTYVPQLALRGTNYWSVYASTGMSWKADGHGKSKFESSGERKDVTRIP